MRLRLPTRRLWRALTYIFCFILVLAAIDMILIRIGRRITPGYQSTRITEPRTADGVIDYLKALEDHHSAGVTPQNNAVVPLLEALGPRALASSQPRDGITNRLGMSPLSDAG